MIDVAEYKVPIQCEMCLSQNLFSTQQGDNKMIDEAYAFEKVMKRKQDIPTPENVKNESESEYHKITLEEAIQHLKDSLSDDSHEWGCEQCRYEHEQLLEWLEELIRFRNVSIRFHKDSLYI